MTESELQSKCLAWLKKTYPSVVAFNVHGGGWSSKGFPDIVCCINGRFVCFELKVGHNKQSAAQIVWEKRIERAGGKVYVPYTLEEFQKIIRRECDAENQRTEAESV